MKKTKKITKKKPNKKIRLLATFILLFLILPFSITYFTHQYHFGTRVEYNNTYYHYLSEKYPDFQRNSVQFHSNQGELLEGSFFHKENTSPKALIVWCHGMKVSYENYLGEIHALTEEGYLVFAYSNTGVNQSQGDSLKGLSQAPFDLQSALIHLDEYPQLTLLPLILIGHSWGGFAVTTVNQLTLPREVDGIISLAGFWKNINVIEDIATYYVGNVMSLLIPFLTVYEWCLFGQDSNLNGIDGLASTSAPVLMIHSKDDIIVRYDNNFLTYKEHFETNPRFTFSTYENAGHTLTLKKDSYDQIHDIIHHQMELEQSDSTYLSYDAKRNELIEEFNTDIMNEIFLFCETISINHSPSLT